jgi:hypothetical protein
VHTDVIDAGQDDANLVLIARLIATRPEIIVGNRGAGLAYNTTWTLEYREPNEVPAIVNEIGLLRVDAPALPEPFPPGVRIRLGRINENVLRNALDAGPRIVVTWQRADGTVSRTALDLAEVMSQHPERLMRAQRAEIET